MINSQLNHYASGLGSDDIDFHDIKMHQLNYSQPEIKALKQNNSKSTNLLHPGSSSNSNSSSNGVYVDMGKVLLEAAKTGDSDKVQECVKNGAPFITDWVSFDQTSDQFRKSKNHLNLTGSFFVAAGDFSSSHSS